MKLDIKLYEIRYKNMLNYKNIKIHEIISVLKKKFQGQIKDLLTVLFYFSV